VATRGIAGVSSRALGAMAAQVWQAVGSFGLQLVAAWLLGASGLGLLSLCLGVIILVTAVASGMVGDSLVILDRRDRGVRAGLQFWALILAVTSFLGSVIVLPVSGLLTPVEALLMGLALVAFQLEELVRRIFMATMRFWRLVVIDSAAVVSALALVGIWALVEPVTIATFFVALAVGQSIGIGVGVVMLPATERTVVPLRGAAIKAVAGFGAWRGAQVSIAPLVLTAMRVAVTAASGGAALGQLELARIYVAPVLLSVQGLGSYLLSSYVRDKAFALPLLTRRAWRTSLTMIAGSLLIGAVIVLLAPLVSGLVSGPHVVLDRLALAGWVLYVAALASLQPFASLAAAWGRPSQVLRCRIADAIFVIVLIPLLLGLGLSASWTPFLLAAGLVLGGILVRQFALKPLAGYQPRRSAGFLRSRTRYAIR
jgi:O-antigen/teichoic acid export membrane protein